MEAILLTYIFDQRIRIGISACMHGAKVRYNAKGYEMLGYLKREKANYIWTPVCPEIMSGMGVPRLPIRLTSGNGHDFWKGEAKVKNKNTRTQRPILVFSSTAPCSHISCPPFTHPPFLLSPYHRPPLPQGSATVI